VISAQVLKRPIVTEKSTILGEGGRYVFEVDSDATKRDIAKAVEWAFDVKVVKVNTLMVTGKVKRYKQGRRHLLEHKSSKSLRLKRFKTGVSKSDIDKLRALLPGANIKE